jgi:DNA-binding transcriptional LysR family regulator
MDMKPANWIYVAGENNFNVPIRGRLMANNGEALMQATASGLGITRQPDFIAQPFIESGEVVEILKKFAIDPLGIYAVLPSNRYIPHRVSVLIEFLSAALKS